ncbi:hypothetical protein AAH987_13955, partial [Enterococcus lactis]
HKKICEEPLAAAGAADSTTKINPPAINTPKNNRNLFFSFIFVLVSMSVLLKVGVIFLLYLNY